MNRGIIKKPLAQQGFTLLEVMVVITIIGIVIGVTVLSFGAVDQRRFSAEAARLRLVFNQASDAALMKQLTLGWFYQEETKQYHFQQLNEQGDWVKPDNNALKPYTINGPLILTIEEPANRQDKLAKLHNDPTSFHQQTSEQTQPDLLFLSSGEYTAFDIRLSNTKQTPIRLQGDGFSHITTERMVQ